MTNTSDVAAQHRNELGLLTEEDTANILLLTSTDTLATWRSQKRGPQFVKLGKRVFYTTGTLADWIDEQQVVQLAERAA